MNRNDAFGLTFALLVFCLLCGQAPCQTTVGGVISSNTHWTISGGPYIALSDIVVEKGAQLSIDPGVEVRFAPDVQLRVIQGTLIARGTADNRIHFTANASGPIADTDRWNSIWFGEGTADAQFDANGNYTGGSVIEHAIIEYAGHGATGLGTYDGSAIYATKSAPFIGNCLVRECSRGALGTHDCPDEIRVVHNTITSITGHNPVDFSHSSVLFIQNTIINNVLLDSQSAGIKLHYARIAFYKNYIANNINIRTTGEYAGGIFSQGSVVAMEGDRIIGNTGGGLVCAPYSAAYPNEIVLSLNADDPTWILGNDLYNVRNGMPFGGSLLPEDDHNIDARNVWWGTLEEAEIAALIYDYYDVPSLGVVVYGPWAVPEPATLSLLVLGGAGLLLRRKRWPLLMLGGPIFATGLLFTPASAGTYPETREYLLGDIDDIHYDGAASDDHVYVDPDFYAWVLADTLRPGSGYANGIQCFDIVAADHSLPFTFVFALLPGETITNATLTVALRATSSLVLRQASNDE